MSELADATEREAPGDPSQAATPVPGESIGRYIVLAELGAGAMGVVVMAYDPDLDRRVAIKLLKPQYGRVGLLLRREAQALAKLTHPNVVAVHDVGEHRDRVFVAMEYVEGETLSQWLKRDPKPAWPEILRVFLAAGRGLAAAHAQGLIHRDFKPDNVMVGRDGRVRVMDFGLARADRSAESRDEGGEANVDALVSHAGSLTSLALTRTGALTGTPAYMAPEQFRGQADALSDQFGFCVSLYQALHGRLPFAGADLADLRQAIEAGQLREPTRAAGAPAWIDAVLARGLSARPGDRFVSMTALLDRLADDPRLRRRRWLAASLGVAAVAGLLAAAWPRQEPAVDPCAGLAAELEPIWSPDQRRRLEAGFAASTLRYASGNAAVIAGRLDDYAATWVGAREQACRDHAEARQSDALFDRRMHCLDRRRDQLRATVDLLLAADDGVVERAADLVAELPPLEACADIETLAADFPLPEDPALRRRLDQANQQLATAQVLSHSGRYAQSLTALQLLAPEIAAIDHPPLAADHGLAQGTAELQLARYQPALETLQAVYLNAVEHHLTRPAAIATVTIMNVLGTHLHREDEARVWSLQAQAWTRADGSPLMLAAQRNTLANLDRSAGHYESAIAGFTEGIAILEAAYGPGSPQLRFAITNLAATYMKMARFDDAARTYARLQALYEQLYGVHPKLAAALRGRADAEWRLGRIEDARVHMHRALEISRETLGPDDVGVGRVLTSLGRLEEETGDLDGASARYQEALAIFERNHRGLDAMPPLNNLGEIARKQSRLDDARDFYQRALALSAANAEAMPKDWPVYPLTGLGLIALAEDRPQAAIEPLEQALLLVDAGIVEPRQVGETCFALARALAGAEQSRARARALAERAEAASRDAGPAAAEELAAVEAWLREHGGR